MFEELIYELQIGMNNGVVTTEAGRKLINMIKGWSHEESRSELGTIDWQSNYKYFMTWYKMFEECGHISYEIKERGEQNFNIIDKTNSQSNNIYSWRKNDIREN